MRIGVALGGLGGLALAGWLLSSYGVGRILDLVGHAGWAGVLAVTAFHLVQVVFSAAGWRLVAGATSPRPGLAGFVVLRWIREGVNSLLPVAQIGGEFVVARLLQRRGVPLAAAIAGTIADLTIEVVTQVAFTLLGLALLLHSVGDGGVAGTVAGGTVAAVLVAAGFVAAQWLGLAGAVEGALMRLGRSMGWSGTAQVEGLQKALVACYRSPRRVVLAAASQMAAWLLGGLEVGVALHFLGHDVGPVPALVIESLGQALRAAGFAVPGALGLQEGGYVVICGLFGLSPEVAIALSLMKRLREVALGVPSLLAWQVIEGRGRRPAPLATPPVPGQ